MAMDATLQLCVNGEQKAQVEELYRHLGTSFAKAVCIFAQQSLREGGMPFRPTMKIWDEMTAQEIGVKRSRSEEDVTQGTVYTQADLDRKMQERFVDGNVVSF